MAFDFEDHTIYDDQTLFGSVAVCLGSTIPGIFKNGFIEVDGVETEAPIFSCATENLSQFITNGEKLFIGDVYYLIISMQDDGTGRTRLVLEELD